MKFDIYKDGKSIIYFENQKEELIEKANYFLNKKDKADNTNLIKFQKGSNRNRIIYKAKVNDEIYYFKKYVNHSFGKILKDFFRTQRATRAMFLRKKMYNYEIPCYDLRLAMISTKKIFNRPSLIVTKQYTGESIFDILSKNISKEDKKEILEMFINFYVKMLKNGFYHGDPNFTNFIVEDGKLKLIDIDDIRHYKKIPLFLLKRNLKKLNRILLLANIRPRYQNLDFNNNDREYLVQEIIRRFNRSLNSKKLWKWIEKKSCVRIHEVTKFVDTYEDLKNRTVTKDNEILV